MDPTDDPDADVPVTDERTSGPDPGAAVVEVVEHLLALAQTWPRWDGTPKVADDGRTFTPHKAIRRTADHLVDHLAQVEALLADVPTQPDGWRASAATTPADLAPFTADDLVEAEQRLRRLARTFALRLASVDPVELDRDRSPDWTLRQIAQHLADPWYADQVGDLAP
jgi:hypothetical protein